MSDDKEKEMLNIAKQWDDYLFKLNEEDRKEIFRNQDKYWTEFQRFEKIFLDEKINK